MNFGKTKFKYNIKNKIEEEENQQKKEIKKKELKELNMNEIIENYLYHNGFKDTLIKFQSTINKEDKYNINEEYLINERRDLNKYILNGFNLYILKKYKVNLKMR
jgi:hypothetical protein